MRRCFITGGSGAIGSALVAEFAQDYAVYFTYLTNGNAASALAKSSGSVAIRCDVTDEEQVEKAAGIAGNCDLVINNSGIAGKENQLFTDTSPAEWNKMLAVHLNGAYLITRAFLPAMIRRKNGLVIFMSSVWGVHGASCEVAYSAAKAGLIGMTKALAKECAPSNVRVNCIAPGAVASPMNARFSPEELADISLLGKVGTPEDVARAARYLEQSGFVTGTILNVDGGTNN